MTGRGEAPRLPERLGALLEVGLGDLRACEASGGYRVEMRRWHEPARDGRCRVCLAGAVMARSLGVPRDVMASAQGRHGPGGEWMDGCGEAWDDRTRGQLLALDRVHTGRVDAALAALAVGAWERGPPPAGLDREVPEYGTDRAGWHEAMEGLQQALKERGL